MSDKIKITDILKQKKPLIDGMIRSYFPKPMTKEDIEKIAGKARYEYDVEAVNKAIIEPMWDFLETGGKRWRPVLFMLLIEALGGDANRYIDFAIIPELVHNGTLVIDDIEDKSETRRGLPAAHIKYGEDIAINFGNSMYYFPLVSILKNRPGVDEKTLKRLYDIYAQEMINISIGQGTDIYWHNGHGDADNITEEQYLQMCAYKTGTLARMAARMAAVLAGLDEENERKIGEYAETIGIAFQIQDDILNLTATSGKAQYTKEYIGSDITEGKRTLMVVHTLKHCTDEEKEWLLKTLNEHTKDREKIKKAIELMKKYGSIEYAKQFARELVNETWENVNGLLKEGRAKEALEAFTRFIVERDF
ncbi:hypothetical protein DRN74_04540 [Candidatus Micrarchaeota archaeon]|nr:MAG: hypothetical protein DRN74_04540 [Candidatus Micrarchaeota archaeon]